MGNDELYQWLLNVKNVTLTLRWYDNFGSVNFVEFSNDKKFQEVHIIEVDADAAYDIAYNNMSLIYVLEEDLEEIMKEAIQVQKKYFIDKGWIKNIPLITNVYMRVEDMNWGETFFIKED